MSNYASKVIAVAEAEVGYLEKKSNNQLDDKTANAGSGNFTKYARDLDAVPGLYNGKKQGCAWCDIFVDWCFVQAFGVEIAKILLVQPDKSCGAGCYWSAQYYKQKGQFHESSPKPGDQIFFWNSEKNSVAHTGLVVAVDEQYVYTIEGNTSGASDVIANGGGVCRKKYALSYARIYGYGRPAYDLEPEAEQAPVEYDQTAFLKELQAALGVPVSGKFDLITLASTVTIGAKYNAKHACIKPVQKWLKALGYQEVGTPDGIAGPKFSSAMLHFQLDIGMTATGIAEEWGRCWYELMSATLADRR